MLPGIGTDCAGMQCRVLNGISLAAARTDRGSNMRSSL
jgi:hypothetical protein